MARNTLLVRVISLLFGIRRLKYLFQSFARLNILGSTWPLKNGRCTAAREAEMKGVQSAWCHRGRNFISVPKATRNHNGNAVDPRQLNTSLTARIDCQAPSVAFSVGCDVKEFCALPSNLSSELFRVIVIRPSVRRVCLAPGSELLPSVFNAFELLSAATTGRGKHRIGIPTGVNVLFYVTVRARRLQKPFLWLCTHRSVMQILV